MLPEFDSLLPIIEDFLHLLSGDQKWKGEADTLNRYPTDIIKNPILNISGFAPAPKKTSGIERDSFKITEGISMML